MTVEGKQAFGLVEFDRARGEPGESSSARSSDSRTLSSTCKRYVVGRKLREATTAMIASDSLVLETEFAAVLILANGAKSIVALAESQRRAHQAVCELRQRLLRIGTGVAGAVSARLRCRR